MSARTRPDLPVEPGGYALVFTLDKTIRVRPGRLGVIELPPGHYLYLGSALSGLAPRLARHLRRRKKRHWHIDALTSAVRPEQVWWVAAGVRLECDWADIVLADRGAVLPASNFGASDCRCTSHLIRLDSPAALERVRQNIIGVSPNLNVLDTRVKRTTPKIAQGRD